MGNFKIVDNVIFDKLGESFVNFEYDPKLVQSLLANMAMYDLVTYNKDRAIPYYSCI